jgi:hypothetical protein
MITTNVYNIPEAIAKAASVNRRKPSPNHIGVTAVCDSPYRRKLEVEHWDEIESDVSENLWALMGTAIHKITEGDGSNPLAEMPLEVVVDGMTITGRLDLLDKDGVLRDFKCTSVFSFLLPDKKEWERQLNCYAWMLKKAGHEVKKLTINAILRDWSHRKSVTDPDYPKIPFVEKEIELWPDDKAEAFLKERVAAHNNPNPPICSSEEKWEKPNRYAVMQKGKKRAIKLYNSKFEADTCCDKEKGQYVEDRPGECVRCENYCSAKQWCDFGKTLKEEA